MDVHPFRAAWQTRDLDAWAGALAPDVMVHSPVIRRPFSGREAAAEVYGVLFDAFGQVEITEELSAGDSHAFFWRGELGDRVIEGADLVRMDGQGRVREIRILIRPLVDIGVFAAAVGPQLGARRGPARGLALRLLALPLRAVLSVADAMASRLAQRR